VLPRDRAAWVRPEKSRTKKEASSADAREKEGPAVIGEKPTTSGKGQGGDGELEKETPVQRSLTPAKEGEPTGAEKGGLGGSSWLKKRAAAPPSTRHGQEGKERGPRQTASRKRETERWILANTSRRGCRKGEGETALHLVGPAEKEGGGVQVDPGS